MDNNDFSNNDGQYHAMTNLNTAIENPEFNVNNTMGVNIEGNDSDLVIEDNSNIGTKIPFGGDQVYQSNMMSNNNSGQMYDNNNRIYQANVMSDDTDSNNSFISNNNEASSFINNSYNGNNNDFNQQNDYSNNDDESRYSFIPTNSDKKKASNSSYQNVGNLEKYEPVMENKKKNSKFTLPKEFKVMVFLGLVLIVVVLLIPYVYDFFKELGLVISG